MFHADCANNGPTIARPSSITSASAPVAPRPGCALCALHPFDHESHHADVNAALFARQPNSNPTTINPMSAAVLVNVKVFWMNLPVFRPRVFVAVSSRIIATATSC